MKTLELDSLTPPVSFDAVDLADVQQDVCGTPASAARVGVRPYHEVAALLFITGIESDVPSIQQVRNIENRALRRLRRDPRLKELLHEAYGKAQSLA
jgi:hypothetical protein